jgi:hypothetical protein
MKKILVLVALMSVLAFGYDLKSDYTKFSAGVNQFGISDSDFEEYGLSLGVKYYANGIQNNGLALGYSYDRASGDGTYMGYSYNITEQLHQAELMYNFVYQDYSIVPAFIYGRLYEEIESNVLNLDDDWSVMGVGAYLNFPSVTREGHGLTLFYKLLEIDNEASKNINLFGIQYTF